MRPLASTALGVALSMLAVSCTSTTPGTASQTASSPNTGVATAQPPTSTSTAQVPYGGAPKVRKTVAPGQFATSPCAVLTEAQTKELGVDAGTQSPNDFGVSCTWKNSNGGSLVFSVLEKDQTGLSGVYQAEKNGSHKWFKPLPDIDGQPAVATDSLDRPGRCPLYVGLSDSLKFSLILAQSADKVGTIDRCDVAVRVAGMALQTMKAGG